MRISQAELHDILQYDAKIGVFTWKHSSPVAHAGEIAGKIYSNGYRYIAVAGTYYPAALLAWIYIAGFDPGGMIDHIDLNKENDSFNNLRPASHSQNHANVEVPKHNTSGLKGVLWNKQRRKWQARLTNQYKQVHLGFFDDIVDAAIAYRSGAIAQWGEFARVPTDEEIAKVSSKQKDSFKANATLEELGL